MNRELPTPPGFSTTLRLLLGASCSRANGRRKRQQELLQQRRGRNATNWGGLGFAVAILFMAVLNVGAAFIVKIAVQTGERIGAERQGKIVVGDWFLKDAIWAETYYKDSPTRDEKIPSSYYSYEAQRIAVHDGGTKADIEKKLHDAIRLHGSRDFISADEAIPGLTALPRAGKFPAMLGSFVLFWWAVMLIFQGEGLELDLQRRRHPMWEWLLSHPVPPGAVFLAEMLSPIAANPIYWSAPLFAGLLYGFVYGPALGILAAFLVGVPITIAAACLGKALEIAVILRFPPRSRGAMIGLMSWMGYASTMLFFVGVFVIPKVVAALIKVLGLFATLPWPWLRLFLGGRSDGSFSFLAGILACWVVASITIAAAIRFSVWGTEKGLSGSFARADSGPAISRNGEPHFGKNALYRKEFLWFIRDRSAIVQTILIPLTVAAVQAFNMRGLLAHAQGAWNYLCGTAILFGTYFLWILGPKSLASEGTALWISLTWPRGLESLLKAKAWLWSIISTGLVALILGYAIFLFPANAWQIALVGVGWFFFGRSMAEKTVTLVTVTSESGEPQKISWGRRGAAQLGMLTFAIGVLTQQWHIAIMGIVYSYLTAAAMWENFRARLPYLYDPWSETLPPPPTLMHAMIAISILVEAGAVFTGIVTLLSGPENIAVAQAISYAICAVLVSLGVATFLNGRGVSPRNVWSWPSSKAPEEKPDFPWLGFVSTEMGLTLSLLLGTAGGVALGLFAHEYIAALQHFPLTAEIFRRSQEQMAKIPNLQISYAIMAVAFAPFAEEYLFRGLLFRALDREWGGWAAVIGSAAFFAIYHSPFAWLPVSLLGIANALLFKKTGRLAPAVALHAVYNAIVSFT